MKVILVAAVILFTGCAQTQFVHPNKTTPERDRMLIKCDYEAQKATMYIRSPFEGAYRHIEIRNRCMVIEGYSFETIR